MSSELFLQVYQKPDLPCDQFSHTLSEAYLRSMSRSRTSLYHCTQSIVAIHHIISSLPVLPEIDKLTFVQAVQ